MSARDLAVLTGAGSGLGTAVRVRLESLAIPTIAIVRRPCDTGAATRIEADLAAPQDWPVKLGPMLSQASFARLWFFDIAAILPQGQMLGEPYAAQLEEAMRVNVHAPMAIARVLAGAALARGARLDIVHVSSGAAHRPIPGWGAYCVSKAAAAMQWRVLAEEAPFVTAHLFQPGVIATAMQAQLRAAGDPMAAPESALRSPAEVADDLLASCGLVP